MDVNVVTVGQQTRCPRLSIVSD